MFRSWSRLWQRCEEGLLVVLMAGMVLVSFAQIALRNLCSYSLPWAEPLVQVLLLWATLTGALVATRQSRHIHIDLLLRLAPERVRPVLQFGGAAASALICAMLAWVATRFAIGEAGAGTTGVFGVAVWKLQLGFPLAFGAMALRFAGQAMAAARVLFRQPAR